jgi:hypothetical protein
MLYPWLATSPICTGNSGRVARRVLCVHALTSSIGRVDLPIQGCPLFPQRVPPRYSRFCDADRFGPRWLLRLRRLRCLSRSRHHWQHSYRHYRGALDRLRSHRAGRSFAFGHRGCVDRDRRRKTRAVSKDGPCIFTRRSRRCAACAVQPKPCGRSLLCSDGRVHRTPAARRNR